MKDGTVECIRRELEAAFQICGGRMKNTCDTVSNEFAVRLESEFGWTVHSPVKATPQTGGKHFVAIVDLASVPQETSEDLIVVDRTLQQFNSSYPKIVIEPLSSNTIDALYSSINF
jgi:hypothetical protein